MPITPIVVDATAAIPISAQIIGHLLLLIATGELVPGEVLPPVVELAKYLQVNHNTIAAVYDYLSKSDYLLAQRGKGTFVAHSRAVETITSYKQFRELLAQALQAATVVGLSPSDFIATAYAQAAKLGQKELVSPKVVFVEDRERGTDLFHKLEAEIELPLLFVDAEELKDSQSKSLEDLIVADVVITTLQKLRDVNQMVKNKQEIMIIKSEPDSELVTQLSSLSRHSLVLLVGRKKTDSELMQDLLFSSGINHLNVQISDLSSFKKKRGKLEQFEAICISKTIEGDVARYIHDTKKFLVFKTSIAPINLKAVKARIAEIQLARFKAGCEDSGRGKV